MKTKYVWAYCGRDEVKKEGEGQGYASHSKVVLPGQFPGYTDHLDRYRWQNNVVEHNGQTACVT